MPKSLRKSPHLRHVLDRGGGRDGGFVAVDHSLWKGTLILKARIVQRSLVLLGGTPVPIGRRDDTVPGPKPAPSVVEGVSTKMKEESTSGRRVAGEVVEGWDPTSLERKGVVGARRPCPNMSPTNERDDCQRT